MNHAEITCYRPSPRRKDEFAGKIIDYSAERPFAGWDEEILFECLKCALSGPKVNMEICSLVLREQKESGYDVSKSKAMMKKEKIDEILWLPGVWFRIRDLRDNFEFTKAGKKSCKVYFIILTETPNTALLKGLYIGQTAKKIEDRFSIHLDPNSKQRSRIVNRHGFQLLYWVCTLLPSMTREDAQRFEGQALASLRGQLGRKTIRKLSPKWVRGA